METNSVNNSNKPSFFSRIFKKPVLLALFIVLVVLIGVFIYLGFGSLNDSEGEAGGILGISFGSSERSGSSGGSSQQSVIQSCINKGSTDSNCKALVLEKNIEDLCESTKDSDDCYIYSAGLTQIVDYCSFIDSSSSRNICYRSVSPIAPPTGGINA